MNGLVTIDKKWPSTIIACCAAIFLVLFFTGSAVAQFTPGNLVVLQTSGTVSKASSPVTIKEYSTNGTPGISVSIPSTGTTPFQTSGVFGGSEGFLTTSMDNKYLLLGGYGTSSTFTDITATVSSVVPRVVGTVAPSGFYLQVGLSNTNYSANDIRGAISDGTNYWASGASAANVDGIDYYGPGAPAGLGTAATPPKAYGLRIFNGQIFYSTQKAGPTNSASQLGIFTLGGLPTSNPVTMTQVINMGTIIPEDFSFNPTLNFCYVAVNLNTSAGGIQKWTHSGSGWTLAYTLGTGIANTGAYGLVVDYSGVNPVIYATTFDAAGNRVIKITDTGAGSAATTLVAAASNVFYKGICFAPVASGTPVVNLTVSTNAASEAGATVVTVTANASSVVSGDQTVSLGVSGTGITSGDYSLSNTTITIPNGATSGSITFTVVDDAIFEGTETAVLTMSNPSSGITLGINTTQNVVITDNDVANNPPAISMSVSTTTNFIDGGVTISPSSPFTASGVISDPTDPLSTLGIDFTVSDPETAAASLTVTATSSNTSVVPNANAVVSGSDAIRNVKITPAGVGYSSITVSVSDGVNTTSYVINYAASAASATPSSTLWHTGLSDASDAIALDDNYYITGDDELDVLNVYSRTASGLEVASYNYASFLALPNPGKPEVDVEAATRSASNSNRVYWIGSMSNGSDFLNRPNRDRLFATTVTGTGASTSFSVVGYGAIRTSLLAWGDANGYNFSASAADGVDSKTTSGFAAEGMVFGPDNTTLYVGMRAPLVPTTDRTNAVIAPILNFETWFNNGSPSGDPAYGSPIELDLGLRGIRDLIRLSNGTYIILAGDPGSTVTGALYKWTGNAADAPILVNSSVTSNLIMEGAMQVNENGSLSLSKLQVIEDGGTADLYNDGTEAKDFGDLILRKFRSDSLTDLDLCLPTIGDTTVVACNSFTWYGITYTSTPVTAPTHVLTNAGGCDSTVTLHLTVNQGTVYYADADHDGFGSSSDPGVSLCADPGLGYSTNNTDCNDNDASVHTPQSYFVDADGDGFGSTTTALLCSSIATSGYSTNNSDCNDNDASVNTPQSYFVDADGDGFGSTTMALVCSSVATPGYSTNNTDCNDGNNAVHPGVTDICNGIDDNCNGVTDENAINATIAPAGSVETCKGTPLVLTANSGSGILYTWYKNGRPVNGATNNTYSVKVTGNYYVYESNLICSSTSATTTATVNPVPDATITYSGSLNICTSGSVVLQANGGMDLTYQWKKGMNNIAGATNQTYTAITKGGYRVEVTNDHGCNKISMAVKVTKTCKDGMENENISDMTLTLFPNPTDGQFKVNLDLNNDENSEALIMLYNAVGQIVYNNKAPISDGVLSREIQLDPSNGDGMYFVKVIVGDQQCTQQIVLQR